MTDLLSSTLFAAVMALFSWWLGTGAILWLVRLPAQMFRRSMSLLTVLLLLSLVGTAWSMREQSVMADYVGFVSVIAMWSWHEMAFLSGWITGPRKIAQDPTATGLRRFVLAVQALLYHELALLVNFGALFAMQQGLPNHVAMCTFALLWCMRVSAKLNLFIGIPMHGEQYLPESLRYLASYFRFDKPGLWYMISMGLACGVWVWLLISGLSAHVSLSASWLLLASLLGLAILEHVLMVVPWSLEKIWGWALGPAVPVVHKPAVGLGRE